MTTNDPDDDCQPILFPSNPAVGTIFMGYMWDGQKWVTVPSQGQGIIHLLPVNNPTPADGDLWYDGTSLNFQKGATTVVLA